MLVGARLRVGFVVFGVLRVGPGTQLPCLRSETCTPGAGESTGNWCVQVGEVSTALVATPDAVVVVHAYMTWDPGAWRCAVCAGASQAGGGPGRRMRGNGAVNSGPPGDAWHATPDS